MKNTGIWNSHMHLFLLISGFLLFPKAYTLKCYECSGDNTGCSDNEKECPSGSDQCVTEKFVIYEDEDTVKFDETFFRGCTSSEQCSEGSVSQDQFRYVVNRHCCNTDLCNDKPIPAPVKPSPNGKKCITCKPRTDCTEVLDCVNNEDHCLFSTVDYGDQLIYSKGCISKDLCLNTVWEKVPFIFGEDLYCCQGDNCNRFITETTTRASRSETSQASTSNTTNTSTSTSTRSTASVLLIVVTLVSLVFFS